MAKISAHAASKAEFDANVSGPLLAIEKMLIGWSLTVGVTLLALLGVVNHYFPLS